MPDSSAFPSLPFLLFASYVVLLAAINGPQFALLEAAARLEWPNTKPLQLADSLYRCHKERPNACPPHDLAGNFTTASIASSWQGCHAPLKRSNDRHRPAAAYRLVQSLLSPFTPMPPSPPHTATKKTLTHARTRPLPGGKRVFADSAEQQRKRRHGALAAAGAAGIRSEAGGGGLLAALRARELGARPDLGGQAYKGMRLLVRWEEKNSGGSGRPFA